MQVLPQGQAAQHDLSQYDQVQITGVSAQGYHGVLVAERAQGQLFTVDATLFLNTGNAAVADDLNLTVNYAHVCDALVSVIEGPAVNLIETLAERLAAIVLENEIIYGVAVTVHKPHAPIAVPFDDVQIRIVRTRLNMPRVSRPFSESLITPVPVLPRWSAEQIAPAQPVLVSESLTSAEPVVRAEPVAPANEPVDALNAPIDSLSPNVALVAPIPATPPYSETSPETLPETESVPELEPEPEAEVMPSEQEPEESFDDVSGNNDETQAIPVVRGTEPLIDSDKGLPQIIEPSPESLAIYRALRAEVLGEGTQESSQTEQDTQLEPEPEPEEFDLMDQTPAEPAQVVIALGANLGNAQETLADAIADLANTEGFEVLKTGPLARTGAVGGPEDQPDYLNTVIIGRTTLSPRQLLAQTQRIENEHDRVRAEHWGPRTLDLDIIDYAGVIGTTTDLELPHPRANQRAFVLVPWEVMDPQGHLPGLGGGPVAALAATAPDRAGIRWVALEWLDT